jgi:hypothetical protein
LIAEWFAQAEVAGAAVMGWTCASARVARTGGLKQQARSFVVACCGGVTPIVTHHGGTKYGQQHFSHMLCPLSVEP